MKNVLKYLLVMIIPLAVLLSRPIIPLLALKFGQEVKLATIPFDPRDIFRGDYAELKFAIENVSSDVISKSLLSKLDSEFGKYGRHGSYEKNELIEVYVSLSPDSSGVHNAALVSDVPPADNRYVRGRIKHYIPHERIAISYGNNLSRFYVKENTGWDLEKAAQKGQLHAIARVWQGHIVLDTIEKK